MMMLMMMMMIMMMVMVMVMVMMVMMVVEAVHLWAMFLEWALLIGGAADGEDGFPPP